MNTIVLLYKANTQSYPMYAFSFFLTKNLASDWKLFHEESVTAEILGWGNKALRIGLTGSKTLPEAVFHIMSFTSESFSLKGENISLKHYS